MRKPTHEIKEAMFFFNNITIDSNPREEQWITVDPRIEKCLNITIPSNEEIKALLLENNYILISNDSIQTCDLRSAGRGIVATKRIPIGSALPYGGNIQFLVSGDIYSIECDDQNFENHLANQIEIRMLNFDLSTEILLEEFLDTIQVDIFMEYQNNKPINCRVALIWNERDKVWYLALAKQLSNANIIPVAELPELLNRLNKLQNNKFDLLKYNSKNLQENLNTVLTTIVKFVKDYAKTPDHFCNGANSRFVLCISGENANTKNTASLIQHTPIVPMTTAANGINMLPMRLTRKGKVTPQSIAILITTQDVTAGTQLTFNYRSTVEKFISKNEMVLFDKTSQPINPLLALRANSLTEINSTIKPDLLLERLLTSSSDELWILIKKNPVLFEHALSIANKNKDFFKNLIEEGKTSALMVANKLFKVYIDKLQQLDFFSLLPKKLNEKQSLAFLVSPHSAFNFLCNPQAVDHLRVESRNPAFNWHPYSISADYLESKTSAKFFSEKREVIYKSGLACYKSEDFVNAINAWQIALEYSISESRLTEPQPPELYQFGNYIYVSKKTLTIVWGLANAYKKSNLFENALYFFNMAEYMIRAASKMADATCNLQSIQLRSNECREKLAILENQTLVVEEQFEYSFRSF